MLITYSSVQLYWVVTSQASHTRTRLQLWGVWSIHQILGWPENSILTQVNNYTLLLLLCNGLMPQRFSALPGQCQSQTWLGKVKVKKGKVPRLSRFVVKKKKKNPPWCSAHDSSDYQQNWAPEKKNNPLKTANRSGDTSFKASVSGCTVYSHTPAYLSGA